MIDWFAHVPAGGNAIMKMRTHPPELKEMIERVYGLDPLGGHMCDYYQPRSLEQVRWFTDALLHRVDRKRALTLDLMAREEWDFFYGYVHGRPLRGPSLLECARSLPRGT